MSSPSKLNANRRNAQRSTGPRTPRGKAASSLNAMTHGLSSDNITVLPGECQEDLDALVQAVNAEFQPSGDTEHFLVHRMIAARWKLARVQRLESEAFDRILESRYGPDNPDHRILNTLGEPGNVLDKLQRYGAAAERAWSKAFRELLQLRAHAQKTAQQNKAKAAGTWLRDELAKMQNEPIRSPFSDPTIAPRQNEPNRVPLPPFSGAILAPRQNEPSAEHD